MCTFCHPSLDEYIFISTYITIIFYLLIKKNYKLRLYEFPNLQIEFFLDIYQKKFKR